MVLSNVYSKCVVRRAYYSAVLIKYANVSVWHPPCAFVHEASDVLRARAGLHPAERLKVWVSMKLLLLAVVLLLLLLHGGIIRVHTQTDAYCAYMYNVDIICAALIKMKCSTCSIAVVVCSCWILMGENGSSVQSLNFWDFKCLSFTPAMRSAVAEAPYCIWTTCRSLGTQTFSFFPSTRKTVVVAEIKPAYWATKVAQHLSHCV